MGNVDSLRNRVEPFAAPFRALGIVYLPTPDPGPALLHRRTQSMSLYGHSWLNSLRRRVVPLPPPHLLSTCIIYNPCTLIFYFILLVYPKSYCYSPYITWLLNENLGNVRRLDFFLSDSLFFFKLTQPFILNNRCTRHCLYNAAALILVQYDVSSQICKLTAKHCCFYMHEKNIKIILFKDRVIPAKLTFRSHLFSLYR